MAYSNTLFVLADPTRRAIFERLRAGPTSVGALAAQVPVSRPAVSQHLKALKSAGLVHEQPQGTRRVYTIRREGLTDLRHWIDSFKDETLPGFHDSAGTRSSDQRVSAE
jgi:DNA-binding transcriptional ArsR family regulator